MKRTNKLASLAMMAGALVVWSAAPALADSGQEIYEDTCQMCHAEGLAGSPQFGDKEAWAPRIKKGLDTLVEHATNGFEGEGIMPERGGNPDLSDADIKAVVSYMVNAAK